MRPPTSLHEKHIGGPQNFQPPVQNDFCNRIGSKADIGRRRGAPSPRRFVQECGYAAPLLPLCCPFAAPLLPLCCPSGKRLTMVAPIHLEKLGFFTHRQPVQSRLLGPRSLSALQYVSVAPGFVTRQRCSIVDTTHHLDHIFCGCTR
jgi:hypothetical protein